MGEQGASAADQLSSFIKQHLNFDYGMQTGATAGAESSRLPSSSTEDSESCSSQDTMILIGGAEEGAEAAPAKYLLSKAPGMRNSQQQPYNMHIDYFSGIQTYDEETLEEPNEGSPEPLAFENQYLTDRPSAGASREGPSAGRDEDKDDGYDSPGGQSSETSSTDSTANLQRKPLKSILPSPGQRSKRKKEVKHVRFETVEELEEEEETAEEEPPPVPPLPRDKPCFLYESAVKIPSFKQMNNMLREQRVTSDADQRRSPQSSGLEEQLRRLTLVEAEEPMTPASVSSNRQVLYSEHTHGNNLLHQHNEFLDSETGERQVLEDRLSRPDAPEYYPYAGSSAVHQRQIERRPVEASLPNLQLLRAQGQSNRALLHSSGYPQHTDFDETSRAASLSTPSAEVYRPQYASTADIYSRLDRQRQNPFRPKLTSSQPSAAHFDPSVSPPREMNLEVEELWDSVRYGQAKYTAL